MSLATDQPMLDQPPPPHVKRWSKREYNSLIEHFQRQRVYLFRGELIEIPPQYPPHGYAVMKLNQALCKAFGLDAGFEFRAQLPFDAPGESMPEPDLMVCTEAHGLRKPHPDQALLVIEVADSSLARDREKALEYAAARVAEYWILDVNNRRVELFRNPVPDKSTELGFRYSSMKLIEERESIELLSKPGSIIHLAQFFT